jgi:SAM-dependent methyltransferase
MRFKKYLNIENESLSDSNKKDDLSNHFNKVIRYYNNELPYIRNLPSFHIGYFFATQKLVELALNHTALDNKEIFEIGCGLGKTMFYLATTFDSKCTGIDLNEKQIGILSKNIRSQGMQERIHGLTLNAMNINSNLGSFDIIWSEDTFAHIPCRDILFKNIYNVLKKNGILIFTDSVKTSKISSDELVRHQDAWNLWNLESKESYLKILSTSGFKVLGYLDNIGITLIEEHIKEDTKNGDFQYMKYMEHLLVKKDRLEKKWGTSEYNRRLERINVFKYFEEQKLDYNFYVAIKE